MRLFILLVTLYCVSGENTELKKIENYNDCFTLPPKIISSDIKKDLNSYDCPPGYQKFQQYYEYINLKSNDNCILNNDKQINYELINSGNINSIKIYGICCNKN